MAVEGARGGPGRAIGRRGALALVLTALVALAPALALRDVGGGLAPVLEPEIAYAAADAPCGGAPLAEPDLVITGSFGRELEGGYVMLPFQVPAATDALRVKYCHDQPLLTTVPGTDQVNKHTLDMGIYGPRQGDRLWAEDEFRGWGGSSRKDVTISPEGTIDPDPAPVATSETTVGYRPGPVEPGEWAVELGVAAIGQETLAEDGEVAWRVEIDLIDDPAFADEPYEPVAYDEAPANPNPGWYAGDFHVHARNSAPGDATMRETFDYAFAPLGEGAGLDFITLSDYVTDRSWGEIGAFQADYPGKLIVRSSEVITYRGHANNHGGGAFVDYRTGPVWEAELSAGPGAVRRVTGLAERRPARPASRVLADIRAAGGWTQLNHVETFPSEVPTFGNLCRGCSWEYSAAETDYSKVDAIEVATGPAGLEQGALDPGPNPFTPLALRFYEEALDDGGANSRRIAAVGSSDSHNAGRSPNPLTQSPIGTGQTVVFADELSEAGIAAGIRDQHTYVKVWGSDGPDLRFTATAPGIGEPLIMGDTVPAAQATLTARVLGLDRARAARAGAWSLHVLRDGLPLIGVPLPPGDRFELSFPSLGGPARYSLVVQRTTAGASLEAVSSPIWVDPAGDPEDRDRPEPPPPGPGPERCRDVPALRLTPGADSFAGTPGPDRVHGAAGADRLRGRGGDDCLAGGRGRDRIAGGPGRDRLRGGRGADRINARDGGADVVRCGRGRDLAIADRHDRVRGCERVRR